MLIEVMKTGDMSPNEKKLQLDLVIRETTQEFVD
jgi:hypothetical protein